jgi:hypothetical protein
MSPPFPENCAILERTGDGRAVGRCWFRVVEGQCPRHGDVREVQARFIETGDLTDEDVWRHTRPAAGTDGPP